MLRQTPFAVILSISPFSIWRLFVLGGVFGGLLAGRGVFIGRCGFLGFFAGSRSWFFLKKNDDDDDEELEGKEMRRKAAVLLTKWANTNADVN